MLFLNLTENKTVCFILLGYIKRNNQCSQLETKERSTIFLVQEILVKR